MKLEDLDKIIKDRQEKMPSNSYIASLFKEGQDRIIQKVGEEAVETVIAAKNPSKERIIYEIADLQFHLLVMMASLGIKIEDIYKELERRHKN